jgi:lipoprotein-anchoring transpeptidase ErfK/SrfK
MTLVSLALLLLTAPVSNLQASQEVPAPTRQAVEKALDKLKQHPRRNEDAPLLVVHVPEQKMFVFQKTPDSRLRLESVYPVSTSEVGTGNQANSNRTPLGTHQVKERFGDGARKGTIFKARKNTGKTAKIHTDKTDVKEDLITSRILWLAGLEPGVNQGKGIDSYQRYIYIHGTPEEGLIGRPASHGCVRMKNDDVIALYDLVPVGTLVEIIE